MRSTTAILAVALTLALCTACNSKDTTKDEAKPATAAAKEASPRGGVAGAGKVLETMDSGGYTYVKLQMGADPVWAAGPMTAVKVGDMVTIGQAMPMRDFYSKTLDRTFDTIYFVQTLSTGKAAPAPVVVEGIEKAEGGVTVAEVFAQKAALSGKPVILRGKVIKVSVAIMGRNWLHLQDGTGGPETNDLTVTTSAKATVGDTVVITGTVATDKDFGAGYKYDVIVEDAAVTKE